MFFFQKWYFYFSDWGRADSYGCPDRVDIAKDMNEAPKEPCSGEKYIHKIFGLV